MNRFGIRRAAGWVVAQLDTTLRTEQELIKLAQERGRDKLYSTRYASNDTVPCPALRDLAKDGKIRREKGPDGRVRYALFS